ncbi:MAG: TolC family protein [Planctomycetes bacterium]|nr:TolC family protein [Planctomycetota bacterium]
MHELRFATPIACLLAAGCQTYAPAPVDLAAHAQAFADRIPDPTALRASALDDGLDLNEARHVALVFNAELRVARLRAGVVQASVDTAGRWDDPEFRGDFARILEGVPHPWLAGGAIGLTLPITGRPSLEKELAASRHGEALLQARQAEAAVLNALDEAWVTWSTARLSLQLLEDLVARLDGLEAMATRLSAAHEISQIEARTFTLAKVARQAELLDVRSKLRDAELEIRRLLGLAPDRDLALVPSVRIDVRVAAGERRRALLDESPRVALARRRHEVAERNLALAVRKQWPELTLFPGFQEEDAQPRAALGFALPIPLWNRNAREIADARADREQAAEALRASLEGATQDLARAELRSDAARERRALVDAQLVPLAEQQLLDAQRLVELGRLDTLLILDALTRSHEAKVLALRAALAEAEAAVAINSLFWPASIAGEGAEAR